MALYIPKIKKNQLFTPAVLIVVLVSAFLLSTVDFAERNFSYSYILATAYLILILKAFIQTFGAVEESLENKRWIIGSVAILFLAYQVVLGYGAINHLTESTYPKETIQWFGFSSIGFAVMSFLLKMQNTLRYAVVASVVYSLVYLPLFFRVFEGQPEYFVLMQQAISYLALLLEIALFMSVSRHYITLTTMDR